MAAAAILQNRKIATSQQRFDGSQRNLVRVVGTHIYSIKRVDYSNFENLKIQHGGRPPF